MHSRVISVSNSQKNNSTIRPFFTGFNDAASNINRHAGDFPVSFAVANDQILSFVSIKLKAVLFTG